MRSWRRALVLGALLACIATAPAAAHGGETDIEIIPGEAQAGATVEVYGEDMPSGDVDLQLLMGGPPVRLGSASVGDSGHFHEVVELDATLSARIYEVQAVAGGEVVANAFVTVTKPPGGTSPTVVLLAVLAGVAVVGAGFVALRTRRRPAR